MSKIFLILAISLSLFAIELPTEHAQLRTFGDRAEVNARVIQLSSAQQSIMALVSGHIEEYYIEPGQKIKTNQKIARIDSIMLSKMTADYLSLKKQHLTISENYASSKVLYEKGMLSLRDLNTRSIEREVMQANINGLKSQLITLNIDTDSLQKASSTYVLYAHGNGTINEILQPLHSVIGEDTPIVSIVKDHAYYLKAYIPMRYAQKLESGLKGVITYNDKHVTLHLSKLLPEVDPQTQRIVALFAFDKERRGLYANAYVPLNIYFKAEQEYVAVKKSALSFYQNEWVVFIPEEENHQEHDAHEGHDHTSHDDESLALEPHDDHSDHKEHTDSLDLDEHAEDKHDENIGHDEHEDEEVPYQVRVVQIIAEDEEYAAVNGLNEGEAYISDKSYYVKSMLLKSSLGGHGH